MGWGCPEPGGPMTDTLLTAVRLLDPSSGLDQHGDLLIRDGLIADFGPSLGRPDGATVIAGDDAVLCPGLVDMRATLGEPGYEYRETIASAAQAAAAGGVTTLAALPDTLPAIDDPALVHMLRRIRRRLRSTSTSFNRVLERRASSRRNRAK